jgi:hypothetical protein
LKDSAKMWAKRAASLLVVAFAGVIPAACGRCSPENVLEVPSSDGQVVAATYVRECGPVPPFNSFVGIRGVNEDAFGEVANVHDLGWQMELRWVGMRELLVTFDCTEYHCGARDDRHWEVLTQNSWRDVTVRFDVGERLRHALKPEQLARLPLRD